MMSIRKWALLFMGAYLWTISYVAEAQDPVLPPGLRATEPALPALASATAGSPSFGKTMKVPMADAGDIAQSTTTATPPVPEAHPSSPSLVQADTTSALAANRTTVKKANQVYTGPTTVILLDPTPMLDEEGKQRIDPVGKLMFNKPISQQRDKKGHPIFDQQNKPIFQTADELGYDEHGKKLRVARVKQPKMTPVIISRGTFTIDGMIGKAELNYDIVDLKYIYLYAPTIGTVVISNIPFPGATEEPKAFDNLTLTVSVGNHILQVTSDKKLLSKKPEPAYVLLDRDFKLPSIYPVLGYGIAVKAPYAWPGGRPNSTLDAGSSIQPPPTPLNLRPVMLRQPCPAGQMRKVATPILPGETGPEQPCVTIPSTTQPGH